MTIKFPSSPKPLGLIKHLRRLARESRSPEEVGDTELLKVDLTQARIDQHAQLADQAYCDFASLPRAA